VVVFSGNGYNAAYEVGVLRSILSGGCGASGGAPVRPVAYTGTSVGAYNAAFMAARSSMEPMAASHALERSWQEGVGPRFRGSPFDYLDPSFYLPNPLTPLADLATDAFLVSRDLARRTGDFLASVTPGSFFETVQEQVLGYEWDILADIGPMERLIRDNISSEAVRDSATRLRITTTNWNRGATQVYRNEHFDPEAGHRIVAAAMAIPGAVPRQRIGLHDYVDGAILAKHPLDPAIEAGRGDGRLVLHVIYLDPEFGEGPLIDVRGSFSVVYRLFMLAFSRSVNADIERIDRTNRNLRFLELLGAADTDSELIKLWRRLNEEVRDAVEVEVHRYRSATHVSSLRDLFVKMSAERLRSFIDRGYRDGCDHDCEEAGCVFVGKG
jgi:predicted acylesterase/phospholipase RssA